MGRGLPIKRTVSSVVLLYVAGPALGISRWCGFAALSIRETGYCAALDRDTAKIVAFSIQEKARRTGNSVIAATTRTDLPDDRSIDRARIDRERLLCNEGAGNLKEDAIRRLKEILRILDNSILLRG